MQSTYLAAYRHFSSLVGDQAFVISGYEPNWDGPGGSIWEERVEGARDVWQKAVREVSRKWRPKPDEILSLRSIEGVREAIACGYEDAGRVETAEEFAARRSEEKRVKLERAASDLARRHDVQPGTMAFIEACESELGRFTDYRQGMREDGLCIGWGVTHEQWSDEFNASRGDSDAVYDILDWLASECPLLWAKYQESKAAEALA